MEMIERELYVEQCKVRAREYLAQHDFANAVASILSDMSNREDCKPSSGLMMLGMMLASEADYQGVDRFIEGFR